MYTGIMKESAEKVAAKRKENAAFEPRRMSAEEKEAVLREYHPDHITEQFTGLEIGPNKGEKAPLELAEILQGMPRIEPEKIDLTKADYETDVLIIGGGGAGTAAAIEADNAGAKVLLVTKLRVGDANTMMAEGGIQAADKANDSPERHFLDAFGGGHFDAKK
ncbi:MAG: FAD-binding protein, partial [Treponema socranskii subsp. buccale]